MTDNYRKYLKYKQKYIDLKEKLDMQSGNGTATLTEIDAIIKEYQEKINKIGTDKPPHADREKCITFAKLITDLSQYAVAPSASVFSRLNTLSDTTDVKEFAKLIGQNITPKTRSIYYPKLKIEHFMNKEYIDTKGINDNES